MLAAAGNSPTFLGHRLWEETRVALFQQAVDDRAPRAGEPAAPGRSSAPAGCGQRRSSCSRRASPCTSRCCPCWAPRSRWLALPPAGCPGLAELRLHQGTVWRWNRAVYDPDGAGHLRIELRALPAGPTVADMLANAAFMLGLALELAPGAELLPGVPFACAERNFYRRRPAGLAAELLWPVAGGTPVRAGARSGAAAAARARQGLQAGVDAGEAGRLLGVSPPASTAA